MAFKKQAQVLATEAVAGRLTSTNLTQATLGSARYLAALTADPSVADPTTVSEGTGSNLRPPIVWAATNSSATPVEIASNGDIVIGPFNAAFTFQWIALMTVSSGGGAGTVLSVVSISSKTVASGDQLRFASGTVKVTTS